MLSKASNIRLDPVAVDVLSRVEPRISTDATISRSLKAEGPETRLSVILSEIADTILPRILCFETAQTSCNLIVSNARVLALAEADWKEEPRERRDAKLSRIADALHVFSLSTGQLSVTPKWYSLAPADDRVGLPCSELRDHFRNLGWFTGMTRNLKLPCLSKKHLCRRRLPALTLRLKVKLRRQKAIWITCRITKSYKLCCGMSSTFWEATLLGKMNLSGWLSRMPKIRMPRGGDLRDSGCSCGQRPECGQIFIFGPALG